MPAIGRQAQAVEHAAHLLRHDLAHDLGDPLAERNAAPLGEVTGGIGALVIAGHVFGPVARQGAGKLVLTGEVVAAIMQVRAVAVTRQGDIAAMGVHARRRQNMGAVHGHALRLVDGRGIAVVDAVIILEVERDAAPVVGAHRHGSGANLNDGPERTVLYAKAAFVLQEHDAISAGEVAFATFDHQAHVIAQIAGGAHPFARRLVQFAHLVVGMGKDDPAAVGRRLPVAIPAVDQIVARLFPCRGGMDHAMRVIGMDRIAGSAGRQIARGVALPVLPLAAYFADLRSAVALMDRAERRAGLDGLQLLRIADQHHFRAGLGGMGQHALQLARADHARLVDHQNIAPGEHVAALFPTVFHAGDGARRDARSAFEIFGGDAGKRHAPDLVARRFPGFARHAQHRALPRPGIADHDP